MALVAGVDWFSDTPVPVPVVMWAAVWAVGALLAWGETRLEPKEPAPTLPAVVHLTNFDPPPSTTQGTETLVRYRDRVGAERLED